MTEQTTPTLSTLGSDLKQAIELADSIVMLRRHKTVGNLVYAQTVMRNIKQVPKINPPVRTLHLSELVPIIKDEEAEPVSAEKESTSSSGRWLKNLSTKVRRKKNR
jgi:hypothetical protein